MIYTSKQSRVFLCRHKVDFRKSFDGLLFECHEMGLDPFEGDIVLFIGRNKRSIKTIYADQNGLWVSGKRFNKGSMKTILEFLESPSKSQITWGEFSVILEGHAYELTKKKN